MSTKNSSPVYPCHHRYQCGNRNSDRYILCQTLCRQPTRHYQRLFEQVECLLRIVDDQYVDTVNMADLVEKAMPQILAELDPHSTYIPAQNLEEVTSELEGSFSGIGIQFTIRTTLSM